MKNITYSLLMIFLFGSLFPSAQAYAKGNNNVATLPKVQFNSKLNDDLVNKLASSKTFESFYNQTAILSFHMSLTLAVISEKERAILVEKLDKFNSNEKLNESNNNEMLKFLGFDNPDDVSITNKRLSDLKIKLNNEIPELSMLSNSNLEIVMTKAIQQAGLEAKFAALASANECYENAHKDYTKCAAGSRWWRNAAAAAGVLCAALILACYLAVLTIPGGAAATSAFILAMGSCVNFAVNAFNLNSAEISTTCVTTYKELNSECIRIWGAQVPGGAE